MKNKIIQLPSIDEERCLHTFSEQAECEACVEACEPQAWIIDDTQISINPEKCDSCGFCALVCPQEAIENLCQPSIRQNHNQVIGFIHCEKSNIADVQGRVTCVHAYAPVDMLRDYRRGVRHLVVSCGDCKKCLRDIDKSLKQKLHYVNALLLASESLPIHLIFLKDKKWEKYYKESLPMSGKHISRRSFLQHFVADVGGSSLTKREQKRGVALGRLLPVKDKQKLPFIFKLDLAKCNLCLACIKLCPQQIFQLQNMDSENTLLTIENRDCNGCALCVSICDKEAIVISKNTDKQTPQIYLQQQTCSACCAPFYRFKGSSSKQLLCRICDETNHRKLLHQVM